MSNWGNGMALHLPAIAIQPPALILLEHGVY